MEKTKRILVVDGDKDLIKVLSRKISQAGYEVIVAFDGFQALKLAHKESPDLIILDLKVPAGGGKGTLKNLRNSSKTNNIPVIAVSAYGEPDIKGNIKDYDIEDIMQKPIDIRELLEKISMYI
jgi:DNA-binding response OmpR family regulator